MNQKTRLNVFETNSSSSHSLTLSAADVLPVPFSKEILRRGIATVGLGEYNWEWHRYYQPLNKMAYLLTQLLLGRGAYGDAKIPDGRETEVTEELRQDDARIDMLCQVVKDHTGCELLLQPGSTGSVDHQSQGNGLEVFKDEQTLKQFLFSPDSYIQTGNDNSGPAKEIETDRGREDFYASHYREPKKDWVTLELHTGENFWRRELYTPAGARLDEEHNALLFKEMLDCASFVKALWKVSEAYSRFEYDHPVGYTMGELASMGAKFSKNLEVIEEFRHVGYDNKTAKRQTRVEYSVRLPLQLALALKALPATPADKESN